MLMIATFVVNTLRSIADAIEQWITDQEPALEAEGHFDRGNRPSIGSR